MFADWNDGVVAHKDSEGVSYSREEWEWMGHCPSREHLDSKGGNLCSRCITTLLLRWSIPKGNRANGCCHRNMLHCVIGNWASWWTGAVEAV